MKNNGRRDRLEIFKKFERMISENKSIYLDLDEIEEIIIHYFHEANYEMAENAIVLANQIFPNSVNIKKFENYILPDNKNRKVLNLITVARFAKKKKGLYIIPYLCISLCKIKNKSKK